jgi:hypothetical protein
MSRMVDVKKVHRGVLLWREDILKCERCLHKSLSGFVRDMLHGELSKYTLDVDGKTMLEKQIADAVESRTRLHKGRRRGKKGVLTVDVVDIPKAIRKRGVFVKKG